MSKKLRFCENCRKNMTPKFYGYWPAANENNFICPICKNGMEELNILTEDYWAIRHISENVAFLEAMIDLHDKDIIEYQLKMSQFRNQVEQKSSAAKQEDNTPKCPTCGSTNIEKISVSKKTLGFTMFGILSSDARKSMHCKNCGYKW